MTSRERMLAAIRCQPVDHVPCCPIFNPLSEFQRVGRSYQFPWAPSERERCEYVVNELGVDAVVGVSVGGYEPTPEVSSRAWFEDGLIHKVYETPAGELSSVVRYNDRWPHGLDIPFYTDFSPAHATKFWLADEQDLNCLSYILRPVDSAEVIAGQRFAHEENLRRIAQPLGLATSASCGLGLTGALHMFGPTNLCLLTAENPELVDRYLALDHAVNLRAIELALDFGVDILNRNGFYETCDFYSPATLDRFLFDRLQEEAALAHQGGAVVTYTANSGVMGMAEYLRRLDLDCLLSIDIAFHDMDLPRFHETMGGAKSYWTGPSSSYQLQELDPNVTRQAVRTCFEVLGRTGLIISPAPSAHSIMPWANTLAMIDEWRKLR